MAEEIAFVIKIDGQDMAINSLKDLKKAKKDATDAFIKGDKDAAKALAELTDKTEDLADASRILKGSGVESAASSFSLLGDGLKNLDLDKVKTGFSGLGSAMKAIPLLFIVEGITYLVTNFDELSKGSGILATVLRSVVDVIDWLVDGFTDLIGVTSESSRAIEEQGEAMVKANEKTQEALTETTVGFDRQLAVAKAAGKSTIEIEQAKQQAIIDTNVQIAKGIEAQVRAGGVFTEEMQKQLSGSLSAIKNAKVAEYVATETDNKAKQEQYKKHLDKQKEIKENSKKESDALFEQLSKEQDAKVAAANKEKADLEAQRAKLRDEMKTQQLNSDKQAVADFIAGEAAKSQAEQDRINKGLELSKGGLQATQDLTDIFFAFKSAKLTKGTKEEEENAKKQFNINKGIQLGLAIIDGYKSISASLSQSPVAIGPVPNPAGIASLAFAAISTAATIAKIASAKYQAGGGSTGGSAAGVSSPSIPSAAVPNVTPPSTQPTTLLDGNGQPINSNKPQTIRVINVESDTTRVQEDVKRVKNQATI